MHNKSVIFLYLQPAGGKPQTFNLGSLDLETLVTCSYSTWNLPLGNPHTNVYRFLVYTTSSSHEPTLDTAFTRSFRHNDMIGQDKILLVSGEIIYDLPILRNQRKTDSSVLLIILFGQKFA